MIEGLGARQAAEKQPDETSSLEFERLRVPLFRLQFYEGRTIANLAERNRDHQEITRAILDARPGRCRRGDAPACQGR